MEDYGWGDITEREALEAIVKIVAEKSNSKPLEYVTPKT
jgi:hypothetical protein